jgi:hypothetical protein
LEKVDKRDRSAKKPLKNSVREERALNLSTSFADLPAGRQERTTARVLKKIRRSRRRDKFQKERRFGLDF